MAEKRRLDVIQKKCRLNDVCAIDEPGPGGANHEFAVYASGKGDEPIAIIKFQKGARNEEGSVSGVLGCDLLEMERDRLKAFQAGPFACEENAQALHHIEEALFWQYKRVMDRENRKVLGTEQK